jgi:hypothetical protein
MPVETTGVYVTNLAEVRKYLSKLHPDLVPVLRNELKSAVSAIVVPNIKTRIPRRTGRAQDSIRAVSKGNSIVIVGGKTSVPYFGWLDFGGELKGRGQAKNQTIRRPFLKKGRYVYPGIAATEPQMVQAAGRAVDKILQQAKS